MTTITVPAPTATAVPTRSQPVVRPVWRAGAVAGIAAAMATTLVAAAARAAGVSLKVAPQGGGAAQAIPSMGFATVTLAGAAVATVLAVVLARWARRPGPTFVAVTTVLTLASFAAPAMAGHATVATKLVLDLSHVVAAAIVIPVLAERLGRQPGRRRVPTGDAG